MRGFTDNQRIDLRKMLQILSVFLGHKRLSGDKEEQLYLSSCLVWSLWWLFVHKWRLLFFWLQSKLQLVHSLQNKTHTSYLSAATTQTSAVSFWCYVFRLFKGAVKTEDLHPSTSDDLRLNNQSSVCRISSCTDLWSIISWGQTCKSLHVIIDQMKQTDQ